MTDSLKKPREAPVGQPQQKPNILGGEQIDDWLHEQFGFMRMHCENAQRYVEMGDMPGLNHSMRHMIARVKATAGLLNDIRQQQEAKPDA